MPGDGAEAQFGEAGESDRRLALGDVDVLEEDVDGVDLGHVVGDRLAVGSPLREQRVAGCRLGHASLAAPIAVHDVELVGSVRADPIGHEDELPAKAPDADLGAGRRVIATDNAVLRLPGGAGADGVGSGGEHSVGFIRARR